MTDEPAGKKSSRLGPTGRAVADNVRRLRGDMQYVKLASRLEELGRPIPTLGLRKIESYERRVDADDLVALAAALGVSPITLLVPVTESSADRVSILGREVSAVALFDWLRAARGSIPEFTGSHFEFLSRSLPRWALEMLEHMLERDTSEAVARDRECDDAIYAAHQLIAGLTAPDIDDYRVPDSPNQIELS